MEPLPASQPEKQGPQKRNPQRQRAKPNPAPPGAGMCMFAPTSLACEASSVRLAPDRSTYLPRIPSWTTKDMRTTSTYARSKAGALQPRIKCQVFQRVAVTTTSHQEPDRGDPHPSAHTEVLEHAGHTGALPDIHACKHTHIHTRGVALPASQPAFSRARKVLLSGPHR